MITAGYEPRDLITGNGAASRLDLLQPDKRQAAFESNFYIVASMIEATAQTTSQQFGRQG
jgi:hypothetical protein